jgi:hypothetical protein
MKTLLFTPLSLDFLTELFFCILIYSINIAAAGPREKPYIIRGKLPVKEGV